MDDRRHLRNRRTHGQNIAYRRGPQAKLQSGKDRLKHAGIAAAVSVTATSIWITGQPHFPGLVNLALVATALPAFAIAFRKRTTLTQPFLVCLCLLGLGIAVITPPRGSQDVYSYAMYGRMVSHYHQSPYTHQPNEHPNDPLLSHVAPGWQHVHSVYGPLFTGISVLLNGLAGNSPLLNRLAQQLLTALVAIAACAAITRWRPRSQPWLVLGLNPATLLIVNGAHNDILVGALIALGAHLATTKHLIWAGIALGAAASIKVSAIVAIVAILIVVTIAIKSAVVKIALPAVCTVLVSYVTGGGIAALRAVAQNTSYTSRASLLALPHHAGHLATLIAGLVIFVLLIWLWILKPRRTDPCEVAGLSTVALVYGSPYVLPWYAGWALPVGSMDDNKIVLAQTAALTLAYYVPPGNTSDVITGIVALVALPAALLWSITHTAQTQPGGSKIPPLVV